MQLTCPACATRYPIEAALTDEAARQAVATALQLPAPLGDHLLRYLGLFRPAKRALAWDRAGRLLSELLEMIHAGRIERKGRSWAAPESAWLAALEQMLARRDRLDLPLSGHNYLLTIVCDVAAKQAEERAARDRPLHSSHQRPGETARTNVTRSMADIVYEQRREEWDRMLGITGGNNASD